MASKIRRLKEHQGSNEVRTDPAEPLLPGAERAWHPSGSIKIDQHFVNWIREKKRRQSAS